MPTTTSAYPPEYFERQDESDDALFYESPRFAVHIDDSAINALTQLYSELLPAQASILDLMSSWRSHLPADLPTQEVIGHGLNAAELDANPQLSYYFLQNLNSEPALPFPESRFDAVLCAVSVQYLQQPLELFADVYRVLKPGGVFVVSFSNRCFPTKAIKAWLYSSDNDHIALVNSYFQLSAGWVDAHARVKRTAEEDPLYILWAFKPQTPPQLQQ